LVLDGDSSERSLNLSRFRRGWDRRGRFAFVRK